MEPILRLNSQQSIFFKNKWETIETTVYAIEYDEFSAQNIFPTASKAGELDETLSYYIRDGKATVVQINDYSQDLPSVSLNARKVTTQLYDFGNSFQHSWKEIARAASMNTALNSEYAELAREGHEENINHIAWYGLASNSLVGLFSHPNIPAIAAATGGWDTATAAQMEADLYAGLNYMLNLTRDREKPDTIAMPAKKINKLRQTKLLIGTTGFNISVYQAFLDDNGYVKKIVEAVELLDVPEILNPYVSASGVETLMFYYKNDAKKGYIEITVPFKMYPPISKSRSESTECTSTTGGFIIRYPYAYLFVSGI